MVPPPPHCPCSAGHQCNHFTHKKHFHCYNFFFKYLICCCNIENTFSQELNEESLKKLNPPRCCLLAQECERKVIGNKMTWDSVLCCCYKVYCKSMKDGFLAAACHSSALICQCLCCEALNLQHHAVLEIMSRLDRDLCKDKNTLLTRVNFSSVV